MILVGPLTKIIWQKFIPGFIFPGLGRCDLSIAYMRCNSRPRDSAWTRLLTPSLL